MKKVTLLKNHTHAGVDYEAGAEIEVPNGDADWMVVMGVATDEPAEEPVAEPVSPMTIREAASRFARD